MEHDWASLRAHGSRSSQRIAWFGFATTLLMIVVVGVVHFAASRGSSSAGDRTTKRTSGTTATPGLRQFGQMTLGIAYGTSPRQLLREMGAPNRKQDGCWLYRGSVSGQIGTIRGRYSGPYVDAVKFCFSAGPVGGKVMAKIMSHYAAHSIYKRNAATDALEGKFYAGFWAPPVTFRQVPDSNEQ